MTEQFDFEIFSDGGGERDSSAAGACIVRSVTEGLEAHLVLFLGGATNNEAEICGALCGFSFLQAGFLREAKKGGAVSIRWVSDSEYVLKSATQYIYGWLKNGWKTAGKKPVKNQGLWQAYLALSRGLKITAEHVFGHSGHPENEACDRVSTWTRGNGESFLIEHGDASTIPYNGGWLIYDGRAFLQALRSESPDPAAFSALVRQLASKAPAVVQPALPAADPGELLQSVVKLIKQAQIKAKQLAEKSAEAQRLHLELEELLKRYPQV